MDKQSNVFDLLKQTEDLFYFHVIDTLAKEYGWTIEYIVSLPMDVISKLMKIIKQRRNMEDILMQLNIAKGFAGKISPNLPDIGPAPKEDEESNLMKLAKQLNIKPFKVDKDA